MLHIRVVSPRASTADAVESINSDLSTANLSLVKGVSLAGRGDLLART